MIEESSSRKAVVIEQQNVSIDNLNVQTNKDHYIEDNNL